jgi:hypothetical protein
LPPWGQRPLGSAPGDARRFAHIRVAGAPSRPATTSSGSWVLGVTPTPHALPNEPDPHNTATPAVLALSRPPNYLPGAPGDARSSVCAPPRGRRSLPSTTSNGSWVPPSRLPSRTRPTRLHGCTNLRDKRFETPFKLQQRVLTIPLCPAFDQHRQNNKAILRGLRARVYSAEPHNKQADEELATRQWSFLGRRETKEELVSSPPSSAPRALVYQVRPLAVTPCG